MNYYRDDKLNYGYVKNVIPQRYAVRVHQELRRQVSGHSGQFNHERSQYWLCYCAPEEAQVA